MTHPEPTTSRHLHLEIMIRAVQQHDLPKLEWNGHFTHFRQVFLKAFHEQTEGNRHLLVAVVNDYPIARLFIQHRLSSLQKPFHQRRGYLYSFYVMEAFRAQGIGTALLQAAETHLRQQQFSRAVISVAHTNHPARRLYEQQGYVLKQQDNATWQYHDDVNVVRKITEPSFLLEKSL